MSTYVDFGDLSFLGWGKVVLSLFVMVLCIKILIFMKKDSRNNPVSFFYGGIFLVISYVIEFIDEIFVKDSLPEYVLSVVARFCLILFLIFTTIGFDCEQKVKTKFLGVVEMKK